MLGTIMINAKDLQARKLTKAGYRKVKIKLPHALAAVRLFKAHKNLAALVDNNNPRFLKGQLMPDGTCKGARINILPDGQKLDKAFSLFAKNLTIHDESSNDHWDVLFQNPGGTYSYVYTLEKKNIRKKQKYSAVHQFEKHYHMLKKKVAQALRNKNDFVALPMYTLLKTYMRVGNEIYYKAHGHKGLTTLKKKDIKMIKGGKIEFTFLSKGGVPRTIIALFPASYIKRLRETIKHLNKNDFIFTTPQGKTLRDKHFKEAFKRYCGHEFYPHIVRSYFATKKAKDFLKNHRKAKKEDVNALFISIAEKLGHKKFDKKTKAWKENHTMTINYYIQPEILERLKTF